MSTLNQVLLTGYLGQDLKLFEFSNEQKLAVVALATYDFYDDENGVRHAITDWHNVVFKNSKADIALEQLKKGAFIHVVGKLKRRKYLKNEQEHYIAEVIVTSFKLLKSPLVEQEQENPTNINQEIDQEINQESIQNTEDGDTKTKIAELEQQLAQLKNNPSANNSN